MNPYTFHRAISILAAKQIDVASLITHRLSLDDILTSFGLMDRKPKGFMKAIVNP